MVLSLHKSNESSAKRKISNANWQEAVNFSTFAHLDTLTMNYGFIKTATAIPDCKVADCLYNSGQIIELLQEADRQEIEIIVFPELCITGYTCGYLFMSLIHISEPTRRS